MIVRYPGAASDFRALRRTPLHAATLLLFALLCLLPLRAAQAGDTPESVRPQLEQLLSTMAAAALAGDQSRYLQCISLVEPVFATEQKNWAADLAEHLPELFELTLASEPALDGDAAIAEIQFVWQMPGGRSRSVAYPARFVMSDGRWLYAGEDWKLVEGERLTVMYLGPSDAIARAAAEVFPEVRQSVTAEMDLLDDARFAEHVQQIKIYPSLAHLQKSIYLSYSEPLAGWNEPGESIKLLASRRMGRRALRPVLAHEFGHVASFEYGPDAIRMPWWILEGIAELVAEPWSQNASTTDRIVREWARIDDLRDWEDLADFRGEAANHTWHVYRQGHHMMRFVTERFGAAARNRWMIAMAKGADLEQATRDVFGMSFSELDRLWRESIGAKPQRRSCLPGSFQFAFAA